MFHMPEGWGWGLNHTLVKYGPTGDVQNLGLSLCLWLKIFIRERLKLLQLLKCSSIYTKVCSLTDFF